LSSSDGNNSDSSESSDSGPGVQGFSKEDRCPTVSPFTAIPSVKLTVQNTTDLMGYVQNYVSPQLIQLTVGQTNLYAQQMAQIRRPATKHARSQQWKPVTAIETKKVLGLDFSNWHNSKTTIGMVLVNKGRVINTYIFTDFAEQVSNHPAILTLNDNSSIGASTDRLYKV
jgi:hypothetical protein